MKFKLILNTGQKKLKRQTNSAKRATGGDWDSCVDWVCAFSPSTELQKNRRQTRGTAHPNQGVDEGILKPTSLISNATRGRAFVERCKRKDHKEERALIGTPAKHLGEAANSALALCKHLEAFDFQTFPHPCPQDYL